MIDVAKILFGFHNGIPLFKNQQDLVNNLLSNPDSKYFIPPNDKENYMRYQVRLKTYISQLLSLNASRIISENFKDSLLVVLKDKIGDDAMSLANLVIDGLIQKNHSVSKVESKQTVAEELAEAFSSAQYVVIITSKPLEVESSFDIETFSLRNLFFKDFFSSLENGKHIRHYRFNFPLKSSATGFWIGIKKVLRRRLRSFNGSTQFQMLWNQYVSSDSYNADIEPSDVLANEILRKLNESRLLMVFIVDAPIYSMPTVAVNPSDLKSFKLYSFLDNPSLPPTIYRYSDSDSILWRLFVWDKLKEPEYAGTPFSFA